MNPFSNRWALLLVVVSFLLLVAELVGSDQDGGGVLSQVRGSHSVTVEQNPATDQPVEIIGPAADDVPAEDQPEIISAEQAEDDEDIQLADDGSDGADGGGEVEVIEPTEEVEILGD